MAPESTEADTMGDGSSNASTYDPHDECTHSDDPIRDENCFFYGSLIDPDMLMQVLGSARPLPFMRRARVTGYEITLWGPYPALLPKPLHRVDFFSGMVTDLLLPTQLDRLAHYETNKHRCQPNLIDILNEDDGIERTIEGVCLVWDGKFDELRGGTFDLKQ
ncbi:unnamed protein product [Penicillium salamii]|nr:unnamed protein product [Penicillium salamii]CAG8361023.1 unnamed protein product [Penicillium salamii]